jgi:predicted Zn finger-like uncharacterized protein
MNVSCPECSTVYRVDPNKVPQGGVRARCSTCNGVISIGLSSESGIGARKTPSDPIGDAFAPRPAPFIPTHTPRQTPRVATPPAAARIPTPMPQPRVSTPAPAQARVQTPPPQPRIPTPPVNRPVSSTPSAAPSLGASLPPLRPTPATPRTPWQPMTAVPAAPTPVAPVSVPPFTPPSMSAAPAPAATAAPAPAPASPPAPGERRPINPFLARDPGLRAKRLARALVSDMVAYYPAKHSEGLEKGTLRDLFRDEIKKSYDEYVAQVGADFARTTTHFQESLNEVLGAGKKIF